MEEIKTIYRKHYKEIYEFAKEVEQTWENRIYKSFGEEQLEGTKLRKYLAPEGGYRIKESQWDKLGEEYKCFFREKVKHQKGWVYFRGYEYYYLDAIMHYRSMKLDNKRAIEILEDRWIEYQNSISLIRYLENPNLSWTEYIVIISFLEWIWNDYASISWVLLQNHNSYENIVNNNVDKLARVIIECTVKYFEGSNETKQYSKQIDALKDVVDGKSWASVSKALHECIEYEDSYLFRAVREGDQFWPIVANCEYKLLPWIEEVRAKKIMLLNNAFGAINIGYLVKHICSISVEVKNIYSSVHEEEMNRYGTINSSFVEKIDVCYDYVVIIDDSIYTGRSIKKIKQLYGETIASKMICFVMTYDISTYFNHPEEMDFDNQPLKSVVEAEKEVRKMNGLLTPARSYWAYKKCVSNDEKDEYKKNTKGSDVLIRILWKRFEKEIKGEINR